MLLAGALAGLVLAAAPLPAASQALPALGVDLARTSVSGFAAGAYMAGQFHIAHSSTVIGAGLVAGGPYLCAEGKLALALSRCTQTILGPPEPDRLVALAEGLAAQGQIDPLTHLPGDRVYLFRGGADQEVAREVVEAALAFYRLAGVAEADLRYVDNVPAAHAFVTVDQGPPCGREGPPYLNACGIDQAGDILGHIYGDLEPPSAAPDGAMTAFDQGAHLADPRRHGMAETGYAYVPRTCALGARCGVHVAFHGCRQSSAHVGDRFRVLAGYNRWADSNRLVILYPEAHETLRDPYACWDWWGHADPGYATRHGRQLAAIRSMLERLASRER